MIHCRSATVFSRLIGLKNISNCGINQAALPEAHKNYSTEGPEKPKLDLPFGFLFEQLGENGTGP